MLITNGKIYTMLDEEPLEGAACAWKRTHQEIGPQLKARKGEEVIDARGGWVLPGFIDAHTHLGMMETAMGWEGLDLNEMSDPLFRTCAASMAATPWILPSRKPGLQA